MKRRKIEEKKVFELLIKDPILFDLLDNVDLEKGIFYFNNCIYAEVDYVQNFAIEHKIDCQIICNVTPNAYILNGLTTDGYTIQIILL